MILGLQLGTGVAKVSDTIDFVASAIAAGSTVTYPSTVLSGDILIVGAYTYADTTGVAPNTPSGWTKIGNGSAAPWFASPAYRISGALYYRVADGTEGASTSGFNFPNGGGGAYAVGMYRPSFATSSASLGDVVVSTSTSQEVISSGSATAGYKGVISCLAWSTYDPSTFCTSSPTADLDAQRDNTGNDGQLIGKSFGSGSATDVTVTIGTQGPFGSVRVSAYIRLE
jgi:hypothetical protein